MAANYNTVTSGLTTSMVGIYTAPGSNNDNRAIVLSIYASNKTASDGTITCGIAATSTPPTGITSTRIIAALANAIVVPANTSLELVVNKLILQGGTDTSNKAKYLYAQANAASTIDVTVSAYETGTGV